MSGVKIGVLISGGGTNLQSIMDNIDLGNIDGKIELVISNREGAFGLERAEKAGIKNIYINRKEFENEEDYNLYLIEKLKSAGVELVVLAGYLRVLSKDFIKAYKNKIINIHPSLIPSFCGRGYYGKKVHQAAIDYGVKVSGATVHFVDEGTDTGPIILQETVQVYPDDNADDLQGRVLQIEHKLLVKAINLFCTDRIKIDGRKIWIL